GLHPAPYRPQHHRAADRYHPRRRAPCCDGDSDPDRAAGGTALTAAQEASMDVRAGPLRLGPASRLMGRRLDQPRSDKWNSDSRKRIASLIQEFCLGNSQAICAGPESPIRISILPVNRLLVRKLERGVILTSRLHTAIG